jgi:hypothetical protein
MKNLSAVKYISPISNLMNSKDTYSVISSPVLVSGVTRSAKQVGLTTGKSGLDPVRANLSARQAKEAGLLMSGTCGPRGTTWRNSADLASSLANKLRAKTDLLGSTLFRLTWKLRTTPWGRSIPALRASVLRTSGKDSTSWATPSTRDYKDSGDLSKSQFRKDGKERNDTVPRQAALARWPAARQTDGEKNVRTLEGSLREIQRKGSPQDLNQAANLAAWSTPRANKWGFPDAHGSHEQPAPWITPQTHDTTTRGNTGADHHYSPHDLSNQVLLTDSGLTQTGSPASTEKLGQLNPAHSRWLQGLPTVWDSCGAMVIRLRRPSRKRSLKAV